MSFVWRKFSSVGREEWCNKMKYGQKLKLGDAPWTPQEISKKYKRQSLGMPEAPPLHQQKAPGHFSMRYIFIASCNMCFSWSVFIFVVCFILFSIKLDPIIFTLEWDTLWCSASYLLWSETRSAVLHHIYFGVRHAPLFCIERSSFHCHCFASVLVLRLALCFLCLLSMRVISIFGWRWK